MNALRRTRSGERSPRWLWACYLPVSLVFGLIGCGTPTPPGPPPSPHALGANDPAWIVHRPALPTPELDRLTYDPRTRTLTLYELSGNDRWEVQLPGEIVGRPVAAQHKIPDIDPSEVKVYYTRPGVRPSSVVTVKQIQDCGGLQVSMR